MTIEALLTEIRDELRSIRADINAPLKPSTIATLAIMSPQPTAPTAQPASQLPVLSTAVAPPPPTAPVAPTVTSPEPTNAFAQAAAPFVVPATPAAPPTASPVVPGNAELDAKGLPWDGRIHASSKAKVADGSWRMKRGVDDALVTQVTAEQRAAQAAPHPGADATAPAVVALPPGSAASLPWPFATSAADVAPPPPLAVPAPPPASVYALLMSRLTHHINVGDLTTQRVTDACLTLGVPNVAALAAREDLVPFVAQNLGVAL